MTSASPAIEVAELEKRYGDTQAVDGISLTVEAGEVFGLLGPNGAGKTTTVEILEGYRRADRGSVRVLGLDPIHDGSRLRPLIGVMLQDGGLYPGLRPLEVLRSFAAFYDNPRDPEELIHLVGLDEMHRTLVRRLSGGQQQRLALALALVGRPALLFLDEPTAGMDPHARATTWKLVRELRDGGTTVMLTTHAMDEAEHLCDHLAIVDHGRLVAAGTPAELTNHAVGEAIRFSAVPGLPCAEIAVAVGVTAELVTETRPGQYRIAAEATPARIADLAVWLRDRDVSLGDLRAGQSTLEEVFLRVTGEGRT
ncbi:MAG: ABC transporter ATP-binding protein [Acidimicrobiia bacterium]